MRHALVLVAIAGALYLAAAAAAGTPVSGGTAVVGLEQPPVCFNALSVLCDNESARWVTENTLLGAYSPSPSFFFKPTLVSGADLTHPTTRHPFSVTYHIRPEAVWSDGVPVTADDFIFTWAAITNPADEVIDRTGYALITSAVKVDDKTVTFAFSQPYAAWRTLFGTVLPEHVLAGQDFNSAFMSDLPVSDGPFLLDSSVPGQVTLTRNPRWWGTPSYLDSVVFRYSYAKLQDELAAIDDGSVDMIAPTPTAGLAPLLTMPKVRFTQTPELYQEALEFHVASTTQPLLGQAWFRQAVAYAIDRPAVAEAAWGSIDPGITPLQSLVYYSQDQDYAPDFSIYTYDPGRVASIMTAHGCVVGADGIWVCDGVRASIGITVNDGSSMRLQEESLLRSEALAAGIELVPQNLDPNAIFGPDGIPGWFFDSAAIAFITGPDASDTAGLYMCGSDDNYMGYCSPAVNALLTTSLTELDPTARAAELDQADALMAQDVPAIPLFQRPDFVAYRTVLHNVVDNAAPEGPFWNLADWWKAGP